MHTAADRHAHLLRLVELIQTLAERANRNAIERLLTQPATASQLDDHTLHFLRNIKDLLLTATPALTRALETTDPSNERDGQRGNEPDAGAHHTNASPADASASAAAEHPTSIDTAEAWRRAHHYLSGHHDDPILIHIQEFDDAYQVIPILLAIPEPPPIPTIETATTLVIDKTTGMVTRWPLLPLNTLARQYRHYRRQEPMIIDNHAL